MCVCVCVERDGLTKRDSTIEKWIQEIRKMEEKKRVRVVRRYEERRKEKIKKY